MQERAPGIGNAISEIRALAANASFPFRMLAMRHGTTQNMREGLFEEGTHWLQAPEHMDADKSSV